MCSHMLHQVIPVAKFLATLEAFLRFGLVNSDSVTVQGPLLGEATATLVTTKGFLPCVTPHVHLQGLFPLERPPTSLARVLPIPIAHYGYLGQLP